MKTFGDFVFESAPAADSVRTVAKDGAVEYRDKVGFLNRLDGPAYEKNGYREWRIHGKLSRRDGPAIEGPNGLKEWWLDDKRHRPGGDPAVELPNGTKEWWVLGVRHRKNGPAVIGPNGRSETWVNGKRSPWDIVDSTGAVKPGVAQQRGQ